MLNFLTNLFLALPKFQYAFIRLPFRSGSLLWSPSTVALTGPFFKHAISTPVAVLAGCLEVTLEHEQLNKVELEEAKKVCTRVQEIITSFDAPEQCSTAFSVNAAVTECIAICRILHPTAHIQYHMTCDDAISLVGNELHWKEALRCAVTNAIEAYPSSVKTAHVSVLLYQQENTLRVEVIDCANGMSELTKRVAFIPGFSAKPNNTGLGLTYIRYVVEQLFTGKLEIDSTYGRGSRVRWLIPIQNSETE